MKSNQNQELLIVFTRYPEPGKAKTRLAHAIGNEESAEIQRKLTEETLAKAQKFQQIRRLQVHIYFTGGGVRYMREWLGARFIYRQQENGDLGARLTGACSDAFRQGFRRVVVIGSDCPGLTATHLAQAFDALSETDLVLGPAADGGYYLIGMKREQSSLFTQIPWSTDEVLSSTLKAAEKIGLAIITLETLNDVDRPEDLKHINHHSGS